MPYGTWYSLSKIKAIFGFTLLPVVLYSTRKWADNSCNTSGLFTFWCWKMSEWNHYCLKFLKFAFEFIVPVFSQCLVLCHAVLDITLFMFCMRRFKIRSAVSCMHTRCSASSRRSSDSAFKHVTSLDFKHLNYWQNSISLQGFIYD